MSKAHRSTSTEPKRRRAILAPLARLYATTSRRLRFVIGTTTVISAAGKILAVLVAERALSGDVRGTMEMGVVGIVVFAAVRVLSNGARVDAQCDLQSAMTRAILESDVLTEPTPHPMRSLFEPAFNARVLVTDTVPELFANVIASVAVAPIVAGTLPVRVLGVSSLGLVVVMAVLLALGRTNAAVQQRIFEASEEVLNRVAFAALGRLEIVARGADAAAMASVERAFERYRTTAKRGAWASAMLGRAPLAAGLAAVGLAVVLDASAREAVTVTVLKQALVVIACFPILLGVVTLGSQLARLLATIEPVLDVLAAPARPELTHSGKTAPELPATILVRDMTFAYGPESPPTLRDVSFDWPANSALFIQGPNGTGKSTLLRVLLGLRSPQRGSISIGGADLASIDLQVLCRGIAYLPQRPYVGEAEATVRNALHSIDDDIADDALRAALHRTGLERDAALGDVLDATIGELSAGQRQRLALARVLLQNASIYMLDEPDANLDRAGIALVVELVRELVGAGRMVAIAAHTEELASLPGTRVTFT
jgi:ABC-type multidrug transport system fused ATPase/permease subunit